MSLEELMDIEVSLVSRKAEKLTEAASAIQVITREEIRRSGASTLPQALRLAANLQVAQLDARQWAVSARGFNNTTSNKLLVMIDGRTVYTPLYSGVFWDVQQVLLEDIDRIEVVSGPGGMLWGANAVNGVINIVTREAEETQGAYVAGSAGTLMKDMVAGRFGGKAGAGLHYRVYGQHWDHKATDSANGKDGKNAWDMNQGGFRMDWQAGEKDRVTVQGDAYGSVFQQRAPGETRADGQNVLGHWTRTLSAESDLGVKVYADRQWREIPSTFAEELWTYDADFQHRFPLGRRNGVLWGMGYRLLRDDVENSPGLAFLPARKDMQLFSGFIQDLISLVPDRVKVVLGSKFERNDFSGFEFMPSVRASWTPTHGQIIWGAVSRAVRSPSRIDAELFTPAPPVGASVTRLVGGSDFTSEKLLAYELGYRVQPLERLSLSLAAFYNRYDDVRSVEITDTNPVTYAIMNGLEGDARGVEVSGKFQAASWWRWSGGYTYFEKDLWMKPGHADLNRGRSEGNDPAHQFSLQSMLDLPAGWQCNATARYVDSLPFPAVPSYFTYDLGVVWVFRRFELSVAGRDLAVTRHPEFVTERTRQEIRRSFSGRAAWRL